MTAQRERWLHPQDEVSVEELCEWSGLSTAEVHDLVDYGALSPVDYSARIWTFRADRVPIARSAFRLRRDFDLDPHSVALMVTLLERVRELEQELRELRAKGPGASR